MFRVRDGTSKAVCYMLFVALGCTLAILILTSESFGLRHLQLFSPNALRSHGHHPVHHHQSADQGHHTIHKHKKVDNGMKILFANQHKQRDPTCRYIEVVVPGDASTLSGTVATVNSVLRHTNQSVWFHLVVPEKDEKHLRTWLQGLPADRLHFDVLVLPENLLKLAGDDASSAELFLAEILPKSVTGKVIYLNNDVIVQGDIADMHAVPVAPHTFGAFLVDSHSAAKHAPPADKPLYATYVNMMNRYVRSRNIKGSSSTFSGGAFVANLNYWRTMHVHRQLVAWLRINTKLSISGPSADASAPHAAMLLVFYGRISSLPPSWHLKGLGVHEKPMFSESFVRSSKLIHWSGHLKPWMSHAPFRNIWLQYAIPDPLKGHL